jgi:putative signal transducing protein
LIMKNYGKIVGYFFIFLGILSLAVFIIELLEIQKFSFDFIGGFVSILVGRGLLKNRNGYRIWAIIICSFYVIGSIIWLVTEIIKETGLKTTLVFNFFEVPTIIVVILFLILFGIALFLLLHPNTRKYYVPQDSPLRTSKLVTVLKANNSAQLIVAKSLLESSGIPCFSKGETIQDFFGAGCMGTGFNSVTGAVELQVISENAVQAREILKENIATTPNQLGDIA